MLGTKKDILEWLQDKKEEDIFEITKKQEKSLRSQAQNRYRWSCVVETISNWSWDNPISTHYWLKQMFKLETTTDLSTDEFSSMCKIIIDLFQEKFNLKIHLPNEDKEMQYRAKYL